MSWTNLGDVLPYPVFDHGLVVHGNNFYLIGGAESDGTIHNEVYRSNNGSNWLFRGSLPLGVFAGRAISWIHNDRDEIVWLGGKTANAGGGSSPSDVIYFSQNAGRTWRKKNNFKLPLPLFDFCATVFNDRIYIMGGQDINGIRQNKVYSTDDLKNWVEEDSLPFAVQQADCTVFDANVSGDDRLWLLGGDINGGISSAVLSLIPGSSWVNEGATLKGFGWHSAVVLGIYMIALGGFTGGSPPDRYLDEVEFSYDGTAASWRIHDDQLPQDLQYVRAVVFNDMIYIVGGLFHDPFVGSRQVWTSQGVLFPPGPPIIVP